MIYLDSIHARTLAEEGRPQAAARIATDALVRVQTRFGANHPSVVHPLRALAAAARRAGDPATATSHLERALQVREAWVGAGNPLLTELLTELEIVLREASFDERADEAAATRAGLRGE